MKKILAMLLCLCMILAVVAGCAAQKTEPAAEQQGETAQPSAEPAATGEKQTLTFTYLDQSGAENVEDGWIYRWAMDTYEKWDKKDSVELELVPYVGAEGDYFTKMSLELGDESTAPDIFYEDSFQMTADAAAGYLAPLDDYAAGWETWNNGSMIEATKGAVTGMDGKTYGVPLSTDSRGIWVNKDILVQAGLDADWQPATWAELLDGCRAIKEACPDVIPFWYTCEETSEGTSMNTFEMVLYGTDDHMYDEAAQKWNIRSSDMLDALKFFQTTVDEGLTGSVSEITSSNALNYAGQYMMEGKLAMFLTSTAIGNAFFAEGAAFEWDGWENTLNLISMPTRDGDKSGVTMSGGYVWSVSQYAEDKAVAFDFIAAMMDNVEQVAQYMITTGQLPTVDISAAESYAKFSERPFAVTSAKFLESAQYRPHSDKYSEVSTYLSQMANSVVCGTSPEDALETYTQNVIRIVGEENTQDLSK